MKIPARTLLLAFVLCALPASAFAQAINSAMMFGAAAKDLRIGVTMTNPGASQTQPIAFELAFQNVGTTDMVLDLGTMLGNGKTQYPDKVRLILTDDQNHSRDVQLIGPAGVAGVVHEYAVPLPSGGTYVLPLTFKEFMTTATYGSVSILPAGHYRLMGKYGNTTELGKGGMPLIYWTGLIYSNPIDFTVAK